MKRLLSIVTALLVAALFMLPAAAIINLDGTEPEWDGDPGIRPAMETIDGIDGIALLESPVEGLPEGDAVLYIGEPTDELPGDQEDEVFEFDRSHLARGAEAQVESAALSGMNLALYIGLAAVSLASLTLSIIALVKAGRKR